jgi:flavin-dependent dehydrogenase
MDGAEVFADLVVDASGRRSKLPDWLAAAGARRPIEEAEESGFIYYTRFFRATTGEVPSFRAGLMTHFHSFSLLTLPGDSRTWSVTLSFFTGDSTLKALRDPARWSALVAACPAHAHWLDGEPTTGVLAMGGVTNRYRRFVVDGSPVATGVVAVGDACACTNPTGSRGMTTGLMHAVGTAEVVRRHLGQPLALALAQDALTETCVAPWYRTGVELDRTRTTQIRAAIQGRPAPRPTGPLQALPVAMTYDPSLFRAYLEIVSLLALPQEVLARPGLVDRIMAVADVVAGRPRRSPARQPCAELLGKEKAPPSKGTAPSVAGPHTISRHTYPKHSHPQHRRLPRRT